MGVARSAFGLSGQKCSAASKAYVARAIIDEFLDTLVQTTTKLVVGDPREQQVFMGPVIDEAALDRFTGAAGEAAKAGSVVLGGKQLSGGLFDHGPYVAPTIVRGLAPDHR